MSYAGTFVLTTIHHLLLEFSPEKFCRILAGAEKRTVAQQNEPVIYLREKPFSNYYLQKGCQFERLLKKVIKSSSCIFPPERLKSR